jgi:adenine-specific DNA-methyltransferase
MPRARKAAAGATPVERFVHTEDQRSNIPTAELETFLKDEDRVAREVTYLRATDVLYPRDPAGDPQLVWRGKEYQDSGPLETMAPPIYIKEKIHPKALIEDLRAQKRGLAPEQADLFDDFNGIEFDDLVDFYRHEQHWTNRLILGESLAVMASLAEREGLKGQVQCVYMDPPYGIKFGSNWQVSTRKRDVTDGKPGAVVRQPEQVKAFRDTWDDGVHSYLTYLRDRLTAAHSLLSRHGSIFVQISDENVHRVRCLLDEVMGPENFVSLISFATTSGFQTRDLARAGDYLLWYARERASVKVRPLWRSLAASDRPLYRWLQFADGTTRGMTKAETRAGVVPPGARLYMPGDLQSQGAASELQRFPFRGKTYLPGENSHWKASFPEGMNRLAHAERIHVARDSIRYIRLLRDFEYSSYSNMWTDTGTGNFTDEKVFVVQTNTKVVERCLLLTTDPGDLVLDPTCGSGTTAYVAEEWGRRWITIDTSRVALTLARQRLMAARLPYFRLADEDGRDLRRGFQYTTAQHVTLKSIANNPDIHEGMSRDEIDVAIERHAEQETLYDQPLEDNRIVRVTGPFTVESLSPQLASPGTEPTTNDGDRDGYGADNFNDSIIKYLRVAGVQNTVRDERLMFDRLEQWPGRFIHAVGEYQEGAEARRAAVAIGPQYGTVGADLVRGAAKEAAGYFDLLIVCGFAFDSYIAGEFKQLGSLTIIKASMNPDLSMGSDLLKKTGSGNLFMVFGEPDIDVRSRDEQLEVEIRGLDVYDPTTGRVRAHTTGDIACWFIDTAYDGSSFFVRHAYFTGSGEPYKSLRRALNADIDEEAWASLYSTKSRPFDFPGTGRIAVKVINHYGDEVMKVFDTAAVATSDIRVLRYEAAEPPALLVADDVE